MRLTVAAETPTSAASCLPVWRCRRKASTAAQTAGVAWFGMIAVSRSGRAQAFHALGLEPLDPLGDRLRRCVELARRGGLGQPAINHGANHHLSTFGRQRRILCACPFGPLRITEVWRHQRSRSKPNGQPPESSQLASEDWSRPTGAGHEASSAAGSPLRASPSWRKRSEMAVSIAAFACEKPETAVLPVVLKRDRATSMRGSAEMIATAASDNGISCPLVLRSLSRKLPSSGGFDCAPSHRRDFVAARPCEEQEFGCRAERPSDRIKGSGSRLTHNLRW
jgi:hypothetical protein